MFPPTLFLVVIFAGFVVRIPYLPPFLKHWAPTLSFARYVRTYVRVYTCVRAQPGSMHA
jgi:hypothetical protein